MSKTATTITVILVVIIVGLVIWWAVEANQGYSAPAQTQTYTEPAAAAPEIPANTSATTPATAPAPATGGASGY
jgi:hypothetical protein